jgi:hypothetical protein
LVPEFPFTLVIPVAVTTDVATGFVVVQVRFTLQLLAPEAMVQEGEAEVRVPDMVKGTGQVKLLYISVLQ